MTSTYEKIATTTLGSASATVTFSSISGSYTDLRLIIAGGFAGGLDDLLVRVNSDSGTNYSRTFMYGDGSSAVSGRQSNTNGFYVAGLNGGQSVSKWDFMNYSNTTTNKTVLVRSDAANWATFATVALWRSTAAINAMSIANASAGNFNAGTTFTLYGIKAE
jgi:hypothetical protein